MKKVFFLVTTASFIFAGCGRQESDKAPIAEPAEEVVHTAEQTVEKELASTEQKEARREFEKKISAIEELRQKAEFAEALKMSRAALEEARTPAEAEVLNRKIQTLTAAQDEALELSFAIESLKDSKDSKALMISARKLRESGETGLILLRKSVREGDEKLVEAAASLLMELNDEQAPAVFAERLAANPPKQISETLMRILRKSGKNPDYTPVSKLFFDNFAGYTNMTVLGDGFNGWYSTTHDCIVQTDTVSPASRADKTGAVAIPVVASLSNRLKTSRNVSSVWISLDIKPVHYDGAEPPPFDPDATAMFYINTDGHYVTRDNEAWRTNSINPVTSEPAVSSSGEDFVRIHLHKNYTAKTWDIFADGELVAGKLPFINEDAETIKGFDISNGSGFAAFIDNVSITTNIPPDIRDNAENWITYWSSTGK